MRVPPRISEDILTDTRKYLTDDAKLKKYILFRYKYNVFNLDYGLYVPLVAHQKFVGCKVEEELHLGVSEQKRLNNTERD
jgi:hypothetical protein